MEGINARMLENQGDLRSNSFKIPDETFRFIHVINDTHIATILPGSIRGNHYHVGRKEFILVLHSDSWILAWDDKDSSKIQTREFSGEGAVIVEIEEKVSHAIKNTGSSEICIISFSDKKYRAGNSDTIARVVIE